jgi:cytochrome c biogenesis protein CcdA/thiol-disulfide isomerase/thioredoxin
LRTYIPEVITLLFIGLVGGLITGISPCILPVLPVIFLSGGAQAARPEPEQVRAVDSRNRPIAVVKPKHSARPFLVVAGLALSFSIFTLLGTLVLSALPVPQDIIRWVGLVLLVLLGIGMIVPRFEAILEKPFSWIPQRAVGTDHGGFLLGLALGAVYVPCAGPVLAAITVAGATGKIGASTIALTVAFAVGTAVPLLIFALAGRGVAERVRAFRVHQRVIRIVGGAVVIALAVALAFNVTDAIQKAIPDYTSALNTSLEGGGTVAKALGTSTQVSQSLAQCEQAAEQGGSTGLENCGTAPAITGISSWFNTANDAPVTLASLKGKVVLIDFWAYSCINCQRAITHVNAWYSAYKDDGFEVIGVHTPEYAFEHVADNVKAGAARLGIQYPVALDNDYGTWDAYNNESWPADYLIDATGKVRDVTIGEGDYDGMETLIRSLLTSADKTVSLPAKTSVPDTTPRNPTQTPETYLDSQRASNYVNGSLPTGTVTFSDTGTLPDDSFGLTGAWTVGDESITSVAAGSTIRLNYLADDVYLDVGGTGTITATVDGKTTSYPVSGAPNIYTLVDVPKQERGTLSVTLSPGLAAYSFTFG